MMRRLLVVESVGVENFDSDSDCHCNGDCNGNGNDDSDASGVGDWRGDGILGRGDGVDSRLLRRDCMANGAGEGSSEPMCRWLQAPGGVYGWVRVASLTGQPGQRALSFDFRKRRPPVRRSRGAAGEELHLELRVDG